MIALQTTAVASSVSASGDAREPTGHADQEVRSSFREDIQGLRAVAVVIVVLYHAGISILAGGYVGVDVFFVISGFLITSQLLRSLERNGTISIRRFYASRMLRLLPAATFVVASTILAAWLWLPPLRVRDIAVDALTTTFYGLNYRLALHGTDYLAATASPSPLQHFWSLAVEEQFYVVWPPLLLLISVGWRRRRTMLNRRLVGAVLVAIVACSLTLSIWQTAKMAPWAYFGAQARAWEIATGALVGVVSPVIRRMPDTIAAGLRWVGLAGIAVAALLFDDRTQFPGYAATLPVFATAAVILGGVTGAVSRLLGSSPFQLIGRVSYAWYLWHWPILVIAPAVFGDLSIGKRLGLAGVSLILAYATGRKVEYPVRNAVWLRTRSRRGLALGIVLSLGLAGLTFVIPVILPSMAGTGTATNSADSLSSSSSVERQLVALVTSGVKTKVVPANLQPSLLKASADVGQIYLDGCDPQFGESDVKLPCVYADKSSLTTVVLFGDSHAGHWFPALDVIANDRHWRLVVITKSACSAASALVYLVQLKRPYNECTAWRDKAVEYINSLHPTMIVMSSNGHGDLLGPNGSQDSAWASAWDRTFKRIDKKSKLVLVSDTAWPAGNAPECVSNHVLGVAACNRPRAAALSDGARRQLVAQQARADGVTVIDPSTWMCTDKVCPVIIGNVLVYKDDSHLSATFSRLVSPVLAHHLPPV